MKYINELETWNKTVPSRGVNTHSKLFQLFFFKTGFHMRYRHGYRCNNRISV